MFNFFVWHTVLDDDHLKEKDRFRKKFHEDIFVLMEMMKQPYESIMKMPYNVFIDALIWKNELEENRRKKMEESSGKQGGATYSRKR